MNRRENNRMRMFEVVLAVLVQYEAFIAGNETLSRIVTRLRNAIDVIKERSRDHQNVTAGSMNAKSGAGRELIDRILRIANALYIVGRDSGNEQLKATCRIRKSALLRMSDARLQETGLAIAGHAETHAAAIVPMGE